MTMNSSYTMRLLASLVLLAACTPSEPSDESTTVAETDASTGTTAEGSTAAEESTAAEAGTTAESSTGEPGGCLDESYECFVDRHTPLDCGGELLCDALEVNDPALNEFDMDPFGFVNPAAATCMLEALAAGTPGVHEIEVEPGQQNSISHRLEVLSDGSVIVRSHAQEDKTCNGVERRLVLQPASYFEACLTETDEALVYECLRGAGDAEACMEDGAVCP